MSERFLNPLNHSSKSSSKTSKIAILIPCYNEEITIADVIRKFREELPDADIYVFDNNSNDNTVFEAERAGATVRFERRQGKGHVVRLMLRVVDADIYVMVDGDDTYPPVKIHSLIEPILLDEADMVVGSRLAKGNGSDFKFLNKIGNEFFLTLFNSIFKVKTTDLLSGYRAFTKNVAKCLPILSCGFEIETELTIKCIEREYRIVEIPVDLSPRPEGSNSKIKIVRDGLLILKTIFALLRDYKPLTAFGIPGVLFMLLGVVPGSVVIGEYLMTGYIHRVPSAILAVGMVLSGLLVSFSGLILHTITRRFQELDNQMQNAIGAFLRNDR